MHWTYVGLYVRMYVYTHVSEKNPLGIDILTFPPVPVPLLKYVTLTQTYISPNKYIKIISWDKYFKSFLICTK